ncbi:MAG: hypothetical protein HYX61_02490 [Gammaproteobacteria bacterium]|jgi:hypothetical protein|nr:hypothetical protein [Gammaproteobacteria bacterium]
MNKLPKTLLMLALFALSGHSMASYQSDAAAFDSAAGTGTSNAIQTFKSDVDKFSPPMPCVDTAGANNTSPIPFTLGAPAQLSCGGGGGGGGGGGTPLPPPTVPNNGGGSGLPW